MSVYQSPDVIKFLGSYPEINNKIKNNILYFCAHTANTINVGNFDYLVKTYCNDSQINSSQMENIILSFISKSPLIKLATNNSFKNDENKDKYLVVFNVFESLLYCGYKPSENMEKTLDNFFEGTYHEERYVEKMMLLKTLKLTNRSKMIKI